MTKRTLKKEVEKELKRRKEIYKGKNWYAIHRNTVNHILKLLGEKNG